MEEIKQKQITFDIDTNVAKKILGEKKYTNIYASIKKFMKDNGWVHIEGSVYMSRKPMSNMSVSHTIAKLKVQYPYLVKCIKRMHQSDISNVHSLVHHFEYDGAPGKFAQKKKTKDPLEKVKKTRRKKSRGKSR